MAIRERLVYAIDVVTDGANKGLANFRTSVSQADGTVGKFKAGASSAMSAVGAAAGGLAVAGGAALVTFGIKAVGAFTDTAKAALDLSTSTGLAVEDASRWIAVGDDYQVSAEALATGLGKVAKTLDDEKWSKYGIATRDAGGKARDVNDILLDSFDALSKTTNETERARIGQELFGKGYQSLTPLLGHTRAEYEKMLATQMKGQVITAEEAKKAEKTRLALDNLHDSMQELTLAAGVLLAPAMAEVANDLAGVAQAAQDAGEQIQKVPGLPGWLKVIKNLNPIGQQILIYQKLGDAVGAARHIWNGAGEDIAKSGDLVYDSLTGQGQAYQDAKQASADAAAEVHHHRSELEIFHSTVDLSTAAIEMKADADEKAADADAKAAEMADRHAEAVQSVADAMDHQRDSALDLVGGDIAVRNAQRDAKDAADDLNDILDDQETTLGEAGAAIDDAADAYLNAASQAADFRAKQMEANGETVDSRTKAQLLKEELEKLVGQLDGPLAAALQNYIAQLGAIPRTVGTTIVLNRPGRVGDTVGVNRTGGGIQRFASGGMVPGPVGSAQLAVVHGGEEVLTPAQQRAGGGSGGGVNIYATIVANDSESVFDKLAREVRMKGPGPILRALGLA